MARTKTSKRKTPVTSKISTPAQKKQIPSNLSRPMASGSDVEDAESVETGSHNLSTPTVSLEDISLAKTTPKPRTSSTPTSSHMDHHELSDDSQILDTPKSTRKSADATPASQETSTNKRRRRCMPYTFTDEQESELSEWYQMHPLFYDKCEKHYKNSAKKNGLLEDKGMEMNPTCTFLLKKDQSSESDSDAEDDGRNISHGSSQQEDEEPTITSRKKLFKGKGKGEGKSSEKCSGKGKPHLTIAQKLLDRVEKSAEERAVAANATVSDHDVEIEHYSNYLKAQMKKIDSTKWMDFMMDTMGLVKRYVCGDKQSTPPPPSPHHPPLMWWMISRRSSIQHPSTPSQASTWSSQAAPRICPAIWLPLPPHLSVSPCTVTSSLPGWL